MDEDIEREVYQNVYTRELTFTYDPKTCVLVGSTTGTLEDWIGDLIPLPRGPT